MKEDKFKKFVDENRNEFEVYNEDFNRLWEGVEGELNRKKRKFPVIWKIAAVFLLFLVVISVFRNSNDHNKAFDRIPELAEAEVYYNLLINDKLKIVEAKKSKIDPEVFNDISILDEAYKELKEDLKDNADNEEVVMAMIQNYKIKLELLESILDEIKENEKDEGTNEQMAI